MSGRLHVAASFDLRCPALRTDIGNDLPFGELRTEDQEPTFTAVYEFDLIRMDSLPITYSTLHLIPPRADARCL
ncbi:uncharacterized protein MYCGRDRAFT_86932 [Zymoseptoria tritici IPO323]|uniref:Uncharacterized protein n=1 Tax=Zymoseptoria tritici (strain CBS 115943 / IPO323) TaxID=336722 RepID=F9XG82_ZYMTI|nr:uncharacterized protein MYCGRDRAFT_86932 [Zymoseptoria tritici IPO323]EGP85743.1 hypothetical protein MYCGRDRAFT_86932 [Zymoseptoria tritici IPO323]